jgi:hypothetical protein
MSWALHDSSALIATYQLSHGFFMIFEQVPFGFVVKRHGRQFD